MLAGSKLPATTTTITAMTSTIPTYSITTTVATTTIRSDLSMDVLNLSMDKV